MIRLSLIGIGTGDPEHLTGTAVGALRNADLVLIPRKEENKSDLAEVRRGICRRYLGHADLTVEFDLPKRNEETGAYLDGVNDWHDAIAATWAHLIRRNLPEGGRVALLIWGDPSLYDSSLRIAERLRGAGLIARVDVVPGITSLQLLTAAHAIPLNTLGGAVHLTTGRRLREYGWPEGVDTAVVFLDGDCSFQTLPPEGFAIYWGAYLGMPGEILLSGPLKEVGQEIKVARAKARQRHGWIMDIYLLRRET